MPHPTAKSSRLVVKQELISFSKDGVRQRCRYQLIAKVVVMQADAKTARRVTAGSLVTLASGREETGEGRVHKAGGWGGQRRGKDQSNRPNTHPKEYVLGLSLVP